MTVHTLTAPIPEIVLVPGMVLRLEAIDPTTGADVAGVTASEWAIYGVDMDAEAGDTTEAAAGPYMLVPGPQSA